MRTGRPRAELMVSGEERATLESWVRRRQSAQALALPAGIVLDCASGLSNTAVAGETTALSSALHAHQRLVDQPGGTLLCAADGKADPARHSSQHARTATGHPALSGYLQPNRQALCVDENRRPNPRQRGPILSANFSYRTLVSCN